VQSALGENYLKFHTVRVRDVELLTGLTLFGGMDPPSRVKLVTYLSEDLWPRPSWLDRTKSGATECPLLNNMTVSCPAK